MSTSFYVRMLRDGRNPSYSFYDIRVYHTATSNFTKRMLREDPLPNEE
jgi:hypothetical protein